MPDYTERMIIVTGGAGFIGSCLQGALYKKGYRTLISDYLHDQGKWKNLGGHPPCQIIPPAHLLSFLERAEEVEAVVHLGAISETTACDGDLVWETNVTLSQNLWRWCAKHKVPFLYASSAATYGAADHPDLFRDGLDNLKTLQPLNLYGWSKHAFDMWVKRTLEAGEEAPPQWVGLKFFNVYGPNEYHKESMISVVKVKYDELIRDQVMRLFRSDRCDVEDGEQKRDFIWVGDVVRVLVWFLENSNVSGLFNCGTGTARSYADLAAAVARAAGQENKIEYIDMPVRLQGQYQSFTQANMTSLREAGYVEHFTSLEEGIEHYITTYLATENKYL